MTDPIQRKGAAVPGAGADGAAAPEGAGAAFRAAASGAEAGAKTNEIATIASEIAAGTLDRAAAMERLVERALSSGAAATLSPEHKARLAEVLRAQLAEDPTLQALQRDLG